MCLSCDAKTCIYQCQGLTSKAKGPKTRTNRHEHSDFRKFGDSEVKQENKKATTKPRTHWLFLNFGEMCGTLGAEHLALKFKTALLTRVHQVLVASVDNFVCVGASISTLCSLATLWLIRVSHSTLWWLCSILVFEDPEPFWLLKTRPSVSELVKTTETIESFSQQDLLHKNLENTLKTDVGNQRWACLMKSRRKLLPWQWCNVQSRIEWRSGGIWPPKIEDDGKTTYWSDDKDTQFHSPKWKNGDESLGQESWGEKCQRRKKSVRLLSVEGKWTVFERRLWQFQLMENRGQQTQSFCQKARSSLSTSKALTQTDGREPYIIPSPRGVLPPALKGRKSCQNLLKESARNLDVIYGILPYA